MDRLTDFCESNFRCQDGPPRAYFEIPIPNSELRVSYVTYRIGGPDPKKLEDWMMSMLQRLIDKGGIWLYWRKRFELHEDTDKYFLHTRIAVLDKDLNVIVDDAFTPEGEKTPIVS